MTKTLMALAAGTALATGAPALSQTANTNIGLRIDQLQTDIQAGVRNGTITRAEAQPLRQQYRQLNQLERQYAAGGLTVAERQQLQLAVRDLRSRIRYAARNDLVRYGAAHWIDTNRDGFDDRDHNRDGILDARYVADAYGRTAVGGPYEPVVQCQRPTGIAGVLSNVLGTNSCGLTVGQRVTGGLYAVPYQYQNRYRDGNGVYYRSDGRMIYAIDARTHVVVQAYSM